MIDIVLATNEHVEIMAPLMSQDDVDEVAAMNMTPIEALRWSLEGSLVAHAALIDGEPISMWGCAPTALLGDKAVVWMLGTPKLRQNAKTLLRISRQFIQDMQARYPVLECWVDSRHERAMRWTQWLGFRPVKGFVNRDILIYLAEKGR